MMKTLAAYFGAGAVAFFAGSVHQFMYVQGSTRKKEPRTDKQHRGWLRHRLHIVDVKLRIANGVQRIENTEVNERLIFG
jgi:glucose-6-phosphate dehydrogenase assembly protein OpcA